MQPTMIEVDESVTTFFQVLDSQVARRPNAPALMSTHRTALTYRQLHDHVFDTVAYLNQIGIGRNSRVALALPDGPELAALMTAVLCTATIVPLNVKTHAEEFAYILSKAKIDAIIVQVGIETAVIEVALSQHIPLIYLTPALDKPAGMFTLQGSPVAAPIQHTWAAPDDLAFIIATSGTTERARLVPRTQKGHFAAVRDLIPLGGLTPDDSLMLLVPMHLITGVTDLAWVLWVGGCLICTTGFDAANFYCWLDETRPSLVMASPHHWRLILAHAPFNQEIIARSHLKFIHAWAMVLTVELVRELETTFNATVINGYGSTETGGVAVSQAFGVRKPGEAGFRFNHVEIEVRDPDGRVLPTGEVGEIVVRRDGVFTGYLDDPEATDSVFIDGWFHIGDLGYLDEDGHLFVTGRRKEQINRGGSKIAPAEVETVLLTHPAVAEAVVFGIPDSSLGEEVGAAVVLKPGQTVAEKELREFAARHLETNKTPRLITVVDKLPRTALGKLQRIGLAERLGITLPTRSKPDATRPPTDTERALTSIWAEILKRPVEAIGIYDAFRDVGGDSLGATRLVFRIRDALGVQVTLFDLFDAPTIADQAGIIDTIKRIGPTDSSITSLIPLQPHGDRPPLFCCHALHGGVFIYRNLLPYLPTNQPVYGLQAVGLDGLEAPLERVEAIVEYQLNLIRSVQTKGPYYLLGYSFGGRLALELSRRLRDEYGQIAYVFCIEDYFHRSYQFSSQHRNLASRMQTLNFALFTLSPRNKIRYLHTKLKAVAARLAGKPRHSDEKPNWPYLEADLHPNLDKVIAANSAAVHAYQLRPFDGPLTYLNTLDGGFDVKLLMALRKIAKGPLEFIEVSGTHDTVLNEPLVAKVGSLLAVWLDNHR